MVKRNLSELAVYRIQEDVDMLPMECLRNLYLEKTSEIIYVLKDEKLYGIICMGEALQGYARNGQVRINKTFTALEGYNIVKAHEIFRKKRRVHKIPVQTGKGELVGDYSRWDDLSYIERNHVQFMNKQTVEKVLASYDIMYLIEPVTDKKSVFLDLQNYFDSFQIEYFVLGKEQIGERLSENAICVFADEDERRGVQCLYGIVPRLYDNKGQNIQKYDLLSDTCCKMRLATFQSLLFQIMMAMRYERLKISRPSDLFYHDINDKAVVLLSALERQGVKCFCLHSTEIIVSEYWKDFNKELGEQIKGHPISIRNPWSKEDGNEEFYGELYQLEDYKEETAQKEIFDGNYDFEFKKNIKGKYFNAIDGRRVTCFQPDWYIGTIYLLGMCTIIGRHVEDKNTIASYLQRKLLEKGYCYRVENYGAAVRLDAAIENRLKEIGKFHQNDIIICQTPLGKAYNVQHISFEEIYKKNQIPAEWCMDVFGHCNHRVNQLIADSFFEMIQPSLARGASGETKKSIQINFSNIMRDYIQQKYLQQYFTGFCGSNYRTVGSVVMNGNPFTKGHRYLVEQAKKQVEFLIIFVIEEDAFLFPFEERFKMIQEGTKDISNVMVVPNGDFILSKNNFWEYYRRQKEEIVMLNAEYDVSMFADYIADPLHITHRFSGREMKNNVMKIYNKVMGKILYQKGISYVEIEKITENGETISTRKVRNYLKNREYDKAFRLLPQSSKEYLMIQAGMKAGT